MKNGVVFGLVILGVALIGLSVFLPPRAFDFFSQKEIAKITDISAESDKSVSIQGLDQYEEIHAQIGSTIRHFDTIKTHANAEATLFLPSVNSEMRILENSEIMFEQLDNSEVVATIKSGDILLEKFGQDHKLWVRKEGRQLTAWDYAISNEKNADLLRSKGTKVSTQDNVLSQSKIEEILASKKSDFFRCYGQLIQKAEQAHGQVLLSFEINTNGKVAKVEINKTDINEASFKSCLIEVVARTTFPKFSGSPVTTVFPLKFD